MDPGEQVRAESGAMMATSAGVGITSSTQGGVVKGLKRSVLGGESLFVSTFTAPAGGGWIDVAHHLAGDIVVTGVSADEPVSITRGCWLASSSGVDLDTKWGGFKNLFGSEGAFLVRASGEGPILLACYGALDTVTLAAGESMTVDTGHVVAFTHSMGFRTRRIGNWKSTILGGEGLVVDLTGPGDLYLQTRSQPAFISWIASRMPGSSQAG